MRILVLAGGDSSERAVSLDSGAAIYKALERLGHEGHAIDPATGLNLIGSDGHFMAGDNSTGDRTLVAPVSAFSPLTTALATHYADIDLVFIGLHGGSGENGSIQNLLDLAGKKYTGSSMAASVVAMSKALAKRVMVSVGVPTPNWTLYRVGQGDEFSKWAEEIAGTYDLPVIVKPNDGGSTIGLTKVENNSAIAEALRLAGEKSDEIMVEAYIAGRELTVSVIDGHAYPLVEIKPHGDLYDYQAKYTKGGSEYIAPAEVDETLVVKMQQAAVCLYDAVGCSGLARIDYVLDEKDQFFCLEINTLPGLTTLSLAPMAVACEGIDFDQLVKMIIDSALRK